MNNEILQLARLIALPKLSQHYKDFSKEITEGLMSPPLQAIHSVWSKLEKTDSLESNSNLLLSTTLAKLSQGKNIIFEKPLKIETNPSEICSSLEKILSYCSVIEKESPQESEAGERSLRDWLERTIVQAGANAEPGWPKGENPLSSAIDKIRDLQRKKATFEEHGEEISFPLSSYKISSKPKTPTSITPIDQLELDGGAEEDTTLILSGESNIGKSHLGLFCLSSLSLRKEAVLLCSGEDSLETTRKRIFAHYLRRPVREVMNMTDRERLEAFRILYGNEEDPESLHYHISRHLAVTCIPEGNFTPQKIAEKIDAVEQKTQKKIRGFMCDYLQKMSENPNSNSSRKSKNTMRDEELENTVNQLKDICQNKKTFGIIISQVPSHAAGGTSEFLSLKQAVARSYAATWGAHYVITMNRTADETRRLASPTEDKRPRLNLFLCKNKDGPLGMCYALGYPNEARWEFFREKHEMERHIEAQKISQLNQLDGATFQAKNIRKTLGSSN
jgi:DnaB-like helicase C terminal domain